MNKLITALCFILAIGILLCSCPGPYVDVSHPTPAPTMLPTPTPARSHVITNLSHYVIAKYCKDATDVFINDIAVTLDEYKGFSEIVLLQPGVNTFEITEKIDEYESQVTIIEIECDPAFSTEDTRLLYSYETEDTYIIDLDRECIFGVIPGVKIVAISNSDDYVVDTHGNVYTTSFHTLAGEKLPFTYSIVYPVFSSDDSIVYAGYQKVDFHNRLLISNQFPVNVHNHTTKILNDQVTMVKGNEGMFTFVDLTTDFVFKDVELGRTGVYGQHSTADLTGTYGIVTGYGSVTGSFILGDLDAGFTYKNFSSNDYTGHAVYSIDSTRAFIPTYGNSYYGGGGLHMVDLVTREQLFFYPQFGVSAVCLDNQNNVYIPSRFVIHNGDKGRRWRRGISVLSHIDNTLVYSHTYYLNFTHHYATEPSYFIKLGE